MGRRQRGRAERREPAPRQSGLARASVWLLPLVVVAATFLTFLPGLSGDFVTWDDDRNFLMNEAYRGLGWDELRWMFTTFHLGPYQPLSWLSLGIDYTLYGMDPYGYHVTSLLIHAVNAWLVYVLALRLFRFGSGKPEGLPCEDVETTLRVAAGVAALLFAIHPLRVESVSWVTERRDVLSGLFAILALIAYAKDAERVERGDASRTAYWQSAVWYALSLLAKATAMALAPALLVMDVWLFRRRAGIKRLIIEKIPFLALGLAAAIVAAIGQRTGDLFVSMDRGGPLQRIGRAFYGLIFYVWKTIWPVELSNLYEVPFRANAFDWHFVGSALLVVAITGATFALRRRWPALLVAWASYAMVVLPVSGIGHGGGQIVADRYSYLPCLALALLGGAGVTLGFRSLDGARMKVMTAVTAAVLIALGVGASAQTRVWQNSIALWEHAWQLHPLEQLRRGGPQNDAKVREYEATLRQLGNQSAYWAIAYNLGTTLRAAGRHEEAAAVYERGAAVNPVNADLRNSRAASLIDLRRYDEAAALLEEAIRLEPGHAKAHFNLGIVRNAQGRRDEAIAAYKQAIALDPAGAEAHYNLGVVLADANRLTEAEAEYRRAIVIRPDHAEAYNNLGVALGRQGRTAEAIEAFRKSLSINPRNPSAERNLAQALAIGK